MAEFPVDHLSYSSINAYWTCPRAWWFRYVDKIPTLPTPSLVFGTAFHQAVEAIVRVRGFQKPSVEELDGLWMEYWSRATQQEIDWQGELPEELANLGARMLTDRKTLELLNTIVPGVDGDDVLIEKRVELRVPGVPVPVIGFIDMICGDGVPYDLKTAARMWTLEKAADEMQPTVYLAALNQTGYTQNPDMLFRHVVFTKMRTPQVQVFETRRTPADLFRVMRLIREVWEAIQAGVFVPRLDGWKHSPKYCEYWQYCPYGGK